MSPSEKRPLRSDIERQRRASARWALYISLAVLGLAAIGFYRWVESLEPEVPVYDWSGVDFAADPSVQLLREYIQIDTSLPGGDPQQGAEFLAERLRGMGLPVEIERVGDGDVSLWAILEGESRDAIVLHNHIDVDPVDRPEAWRLPPFAAEISGPWLYGRGAFDMKSVAVAQLVALERLIASGRKPARSVIFLATSGEETGSDLGMKWFLREHPELVERFAMALTEGGAVEGREQDDVKYWGTEFVQKRPLRVTVCGDSRERLESLRRELIKDGRRLDGLALSPELLAFLEQYGPTRDYVGLRDLLAKPEVMLRDPAAFSTLPGFLQSMFRNEVVPFPVEEVDGGWQMMLSVQLIPGADAETVLAERLPPWRLHGLSVTVYDEGAASHGSAPGHEVIEIAREVLAERYPGTPSGPLFLPWTLTDARFLRARGVPTYGFSPFMVLTPEVLQLVQERTINERIALPGFVDGVEVYSELLARLASIPESSQKLAD